MHEKSARCMHNTLATSNNSNNNDNDDNSDNNIQLLWQQRHCGGDGSDRGGVETQTARKLVRLLTFFLSFNLHFPMHNLWYKVLLAGLCQSLLNIKSLKSLRAFHTRFASLAFHFAHRLINIEFFRSSIQLSRNKVHLCAFISLSLSLWFCAHEGITASIYISHGNKGTWIFANHRHFNQSSSQ